MKHVHCDKIVAKAVNMELVVFFNPSFGSGCDKWEEATTKLFPAFHPDTEYFLCLPQHRDACLHWLNGGDIQVLDSNWINVHPVESYPWESEHDFMCEDSKIRIKPKKEKRWIATFPWYGNAFYVTPESFASEGLLNDYVDMHYGRRDLMLTHEIEVEV